MAVPQARSKALDQYVDDMAYKTAIDLVSKVTQELVTKVLAINGVTRPFNQPWVTLYGEYAKRFMELLMATLKQEPNWIDYRALDDALNKHIKLISEIIFSTPVPEIPTNGILVLLMSLVDPRVSKKFQSQQLELKRRIEDVISALNKLLETSAALDSQLAEFVKKTDRMANQNQPRNNFDLVYVNINFASRVKNLCLTANSLLAESKRLSDHRNQWADLINSNRINFNTHSEFIGACSDVGF